VSEENQNAEELVDSTELTEAEEVKKDPDGMEWYIVHTYSGFENKVKLSLEERIRTNSMEHLFGEVLVPEESVVELVKGQKRTAKRKIFPSYIMIKMILTDETWHLVTDTPKVTGFVAGNKQKPQPVPEAEILKMTNRIKEGAGRPKHRITFQEGEKVRVVDGPFANFNGVVEDVNPDKAKVKVKVSIFGRPTPVELDFVQVEKV